MRSRSLLALTAALSLAAAGSLRGQVSDPNADGLTRGYYFRLSGGLAKPINPGGSLKDWGGGQSVNLMWENWDEVNGRMGILGFALYGDLSLLPFKENEFK